MLSLFPDDEPDSIQVLRKFIRSFLTDELAKMKSEIDDKLKAVTETFNSKVTAGEQESATKTRKSPKTTANKNKKK